MLHLDGLGRRYGALAALTNITLTVNTGTRHAVIGANGAGKTTLLHLIAGSVRPTTGRVLLDGREITRLGPASRARRGVARTFQHPAVFPRLTVTANVALALTRHTRTPARLRLLCGRGVVDQARAVLAAAGLTAHADTTAGQLPYGLRRLLELALALATKPRLLLLDEPSAGLEADEIRRLAATIRALPREATVILVDHHLDLVWDIADTVTVLDHGEHLATGTPDQIRANPAVQAAYLTPAFPPDTATAAPPAGPADHRPALLQVRGLQVGYHGAPVIDGLDLDVAEGEVLAILGRNGAGKTTLLNTLAGLCTPAASTTVHLAGTPLPAGQPNRTSRAGLALVPQGRRLFNLTVAEHLTAATATRTRGSHGRTWTRDEVLDLLPPLRGRLRHHATQLSGGEQQMLALARALLTHPRLLLLDEPTEGLAPRLVEQLTATIRAISTEHVTVLLAEQNLHLAIDLVHRVIILDHGHLALTTTPTDLRSDPDQRHRLDQLLGVLPTGPAA
ncbi:ATP-binding cassette domain-containing protein [Actinomycetes bacterium KLBMP 9797]